MIGIWECPCGAPWPDTRRGDVSKGRSPLREREHTTVKEFQKPIEARYIGAEVRSKSLGVKIFVEVEARAYYTKSQSEAGTIHRMLRSGQGWSCECKGYAFTGSCKHIGALARRAMREGWDFGAIAPRLAA